MRRTLTLAAGLCLAAIAILSGCAVSQNGAVEPTPTERPYVGENPPSMGDNERYRERIDPDPASLADAEALVAPVTAALQPLADGATAISEAAVRTALIGAGVPDDGIQLVSGVGVAFGASTGGACLFGGVKPGEVTVEAGGYIRDGGCLALEGH